jgi:hypothetical protein
MPVRRPPVTTGIRSCSARATGATSLTGTATGDMEAIVADLDTRRHPFHVAIENWGHDFNIGSVVRTANAFNAAAFHIVGKRRWNRRGAMVTDRYQHEHHHPDAPPRNRWAQPVRGDPGHGIPDHRDRQRARLGRRWRPTTCRASACSSSGRRARGSRPRCSRYAVWCCTSSSSARRARSTPAPRPRSPCTRGCDATSSTKGPDRCGGSTQWSHSRRRGHSLNRSKLRMTWPSLSCMVTCWLTR